MNFYKPLVVASSLLMLASCGASRTPENAASPQKSSQTTNTTADPKKVAQYLVNAGFNEENAQRIKSNLKYLKESQDKSSVSNQALANEQSRIIGETMDIVIDGGVTKNSMNSQAVTRDLVVNAASNISLYSMSNFSYYQNQGYLSQTYPYRLDYVDNGCSAPDIFFVPNNVFYEACDQHDFGYRNGTFSELHNPSFKQAVDIKLYDNAIILCDQYQPGFPVNDSCRSEAAAFYSAVVFPGVTAAWLALPSQ